MEELIQLKSFPVKIVLEKLLRDKTTGKNIIFATDTYQSFGIGYSDTDEITAESIEGFFAANIQPRVTREQEQQSERTRKKAEVFTPTWIVKKMNDHCDSVWQEDNGTEEWQKYVKQRILEITCGEAPFLVTRYDTTTGEPLPIDKRTGMLDRKLKIVNENTSDEEEWKKWAVIAFKSTYGYEYQGDNLLIARINLLVTFCDYLKKKFNRQPTKSELSNIANIISWNIWQIDGLKDTVPLGMPGEKFSQLSLFEEPAEKVQADDCKIRDWRNEKSVLFRDIKEGSTRMKFDFVIGNPPYQDNTLGDNDTYAPPVYHLFMDAAYSVSDKVELITPARFLFNAGSTPKTWNKKMLNDSHFKTLWYEEDSKKVFTNTEIKGGIIISYRDNENSFDKIKIFTPHKTLNCILKKVNSISHDSLSTIVITRTAYRLTDTLHKEHPEAIKQLSKGHAYDMSTNIFERLPQIFFDQRPQDEHDYIKILGRENNERVFKYVRRDYVNTPINLDKYKVFIPSANGDGTLGEILSQPFVSEPAFGATETFISIGSFDTREEAENALSYIKTKFSRAMLSILKTTQHITPEKWKYVPLQDFTPNSDIDWNVSIAEIDKQLYKKYGLSQEEIDFIETHVKEME